MARPRPTRAASTAAERATARRPQWKSRRPAGARRAAGARRPDGERRAAGARHAAEPRGGEGRCRLRIAPIAALLALFLSLVLPAGGASAARAVGAELSAQGSGSRFVLELTEEPEARGFVVSSPPRLVVDLDDVSFRLREGPQDDRAQPPAGPVTGWRWGTLDSGAARLVFDLSRPALISRQFYLPAMAGAPGRLVIEVVPVTQARFEAAVAAATARADAPAVIAATRDDHVVVIDPGHGGIDPGASTPEGTLEKDLVMAFATRLRGKLEAIPGVTVRLTRNDDRFLSLSRRIRIARAFDADLFLSIHADAAPQNYVTGATVYTLSERASDAQAAALAARENLADRVSGAIEPDNQEEVSGILADLLRKETKAFSHAFATTLIDSLEGRVRLNSNPHRAARFRVLMAHDIPSVLLELGYLTNAADSEALLREAWQERAALAIADAVARHFFVEQGRRQTRVPGSEGEAAPTAAPAAATAAASSPG